MGSPSLPPAAQVGHTRSTVQGSSTTGGHLPWSASNSRLQALGLLAQTEVRKAPGQFEPGSRRIQVDLWVLPHSGHVGD